MIRNNTRKEIPHFVRNDKITLLLGEIEGATDSPKANLSLPRFLKQIIKALSFRVTTFSKKRKKCE